MAGAARADARAALATWLVWLAAVVGAVALLVASGLIASGPHHGMPGVVREGALWPLRSWDAAWYERIADSGYPAGRVTREDAFFPLWPAVLAAVGRAGAAALAAAASLAAFLAVARLAPEGRRAVVALACLPGSFALALLYPDGLALAACAWACVLARDGRLAPAGALAAVAAAARPNGFLAALPVAVLALQAGAPRGRALLAGGAGASRSPPRSTSTSGSARASRSRSRRRSGAGAAAIPGTWRRAWPTSPRAGTCRRSPRRPSPCSRWWPAPGCSAWAWPDRGAGSPRRCWCSRWDRGASSRSAGRPCSRSRWRSPPRGWRRGRERAAVALGVAANLALIAALPWMAP